MMTTKAAESCRNCGKRLQDAKECKCCTKVYCYRCIQWDGYCDSCHYARLVETNEGARH